MENETGKHNHAFLIFTPESYRRPHQHYFVALSLMMVKD